MAPGGGAADGGNTGAPEAPPSTGGGPKVLRCALDWMTCLCLVPVTRARWAALGELARHGVGVSIPSPVGPLPVELHRLGKDIAGKSVAGFRVLLREPEGCSVVEAASCTRSEVTGSPRGLVPSRSWSRVCEADGGNAEGIAPELLPLLALDAGRSRAGCPSVCSGSADVVVTAGLQRREGDDVRAVYGVEVQIQGTAFSAVPAGGDELVAGIWRGLVEWLFAGRWPDPVAVLDPFTRAGRFDVATDTAFVGPDGADWITGGIFGDGSHDVCFRRFSTRARKVRSEETVRELPEGAPEAEGAVLPHVPVSGRRALLGKSTAGRTAYMGSAAYVLLCIYERSKKRDGDWAVLGPTLRGCGWDGVAEVIRTEFRGSRKWLGDQVLRNPDGSPMFPRVFRMPGQPDGLDGSELTLSQFLRALPSLVAEFPSRFRHTDPAQDDGRGPRVRDRRSSEWWSGVEGAALHWASGSGDVGRVVSTRRHAAAERTGKAVRSGLARLVALRGGRHLSDVLGEVFELWNDPEWREALALKLAKVRARYGIQLAPPFSALAAVG